MFKNKKILLGISGSIAAYKSILLVRELKKLGADVRVITTESALDFVTPTTLSTLSGNPVHTSFYKNKDTGEWVNHVDLGKWADLMLIAPLSANTLAKLAYGICDNLLLATYLSATCQVVVAPAMDLDMYAHTTTNDNLARLQERGDLVIEAEDGELASGLVGKGRMAEPENIIEYLSGYFSEPSKLKGKRVLVTAGPTYEDIDPVRFIGNHSSGKMGFKIADELASRGCEVILVAGPTNQELNESATRVNVRSAGEMLEVVTQHYSKVDAVIMSAAVADYRPKNVASKKLKKEEVDLTKIELEPTEDILKHLGSNKTHQRLVGFALETDNELANAQAKLKRKNLDFLVLNSLKDKGAGFGTDTNKVTFVFNDHTKTFELKSKAEVAKDIIDELENLF